MSDIKDYADVFPSAMPTEAEIVAWDQLSREEQLRRLRIALTDPACAEMTDLTMEDILTEARQRWQKREGNG